LSRPAGRLVVVSANLSLAGGGAAALGRLVVQCAAGYSGSRGLAFEVLHLGRHEGVIGDLPARHFDGSQLRLAAALAALQVSRRTAVVFDHPGPARVQALLPPPARCPYAVFLLGVELERRLGWDRRRALAKATTRIAISEHTRRLAGSAGLATESIAVLHPALEERPEEGRADAELLGRVGEGYLLIVGRLDSRERYKGHDALIDGLPSLRAFVPEARLVVVGDGDDRGRLEAKTRAAGLEKAVVFAGFVSEATRRALYERCRALVMPSSGEGFGLVYLEAMRAGRACVALARSAAAEILLHEETGLLVEASGAPLLQALTRLFREAGLATRLGVAGARRYRDSFSRAVFERGLAAHLDRLREAA
jgi:phosphatidylinositol alpha-1,6-mannosyltransferase